MTKKQLKLMWWGLGFLFVLLAPVIQKISPLRGDLFEVIQVLDGDTIEVNMSGNIESVRFIGIDTPETHHPDVGEQCYGQEASDNLTALVGKKVQLVADPNSTNRDRYDRLLRFVYNQEGQHLNYSQVRDGFAFATVSFRHSLIPVFVGAEALAVRDQKGVWSNCEIDFDKGYPQTQVID